mmetsp:Transcript_179/g.550  ORF Transcript_179/g.550 Transcript_179/m.550 type:complete len:448 (-) Transcript_179:1343-2686(-)
MRGRPARTQPHTRAARHGRAWHHRRLVGAHRRGRVRGRGLGGQAERADPAPLQPSRLHLRYAREPVPLVREVHARRREPREGRVPLQRRAHALPPLPRELVSAPVVALPLHEARGGELRLVRAVVAHVRAQVLHPVRGQHGLVRDEVPAELRPVPRHHEVRRVPENLRPTHPPGGEALVLLGLVHPLHGLGGPQGVHSDLGLRHEADLGLLARADLLLVHRAEHVEPPHVRAERVEAVRRVVGAVRHGRGDDGEEVRHGGALPVLLHVVARVTEREEVGPRREAEQPVEALGVRLLRRAHLLPLGLARPHEHVDAVVQEVLRALDDALQLLLEREVRHLHAHLRRALALEDAQGPVSWVLPVRVRRLRLPAPLAPGRVGVVRYHEDGRPVLRGPLGERQPRAELAPDHNHVLAVQRVVAVRQAEALRGLESAQGRLPVQHEVSAEHL